MDYITVTQAAEKWGLSTRRVRLLCANGDIAGVTRRGNLYMIPEEAEKPVDRRKLPRNNRQGPFSDLFLEIDTKLAKLNALRPLTSGEAKRLRDELWWTLSTTPTPLRAIP